MKPVSRFYEYAQLGREGRRVVGKGWLTKTPIPAKRHDVVSSCNRQSMGNGRDSAQLLTVSKWGVAVKTNVTTLLHLSTVVPTAINRFGLHAVRNGNRLRLCAVANC